MHNILLTFARAYHRRFALARARKPAEMGYLAFVVDIYGKGIRPNTPAEAAAHAGIYKKDR
jgi:hypothetical protein